MSNLQDILSRSEGPHAAYSAGTVQDFQARLDKLNLSCGLHDPTDGRTCAMEAAAYVAGEPWSDKPKCVSGPLGEYLRNWNDRLPSDAERNRVIRPYLGMVIGTAGTYETELAHSFMIADWMLRTHLASLLAMWRPTRGSAKRLVECREITSADTLSLAIAVLKDIEYDVWQQLYDQPFHGPLERQDADRFVQATGMPQYWFPFLSHHHTSGANIMPAWKSSSSSQFTVAMLCNALVVNIAKIVSESTMTNLQTYLQATAQNLIHKISTHGRTA